MAKYIVELSHENSCRVLEWTYTDKDLAMARITSLLVKYPEHNVIIDKDLTDDDQTVYAVIVPTKLQSLL